MDKISNKKTNGNFANTVLADAVFRPILFSTSMVQAILDGRKTQTRRIIKPQPSKKLFDVRMGYWSEEPENLKHPYVKSKYKVGDILWVRETWSPGSIENGIKTRFIYRADGERTYETNGTVLKTKWKPSIFMPKEACRIFLKVTNVRVERVQDITTMDAYSEGIKMTVSSSDADCYLTAEEAFQLLWESINGKESWDKNPWVWVYDFERIERPLGFC